MRALILDGPGGFGRALAGELGRSGVEAVLAGRDPLRYEQTVNLRGDLSEFRRVAGQSAVVVNASGVRNPRLAERSGVAFVELSSEESYLSELAGQPAAAPVLAGARLIPVLAGVLARDVMAASDGPVEIGVVLGAGDPQSAADIGSTYRLFGRYFTDPATGEEVLNFSDRRDLQLPDGTSRSMARVNFPDQQMLTAGLGRPVRTYLATADRFSTAVLQGLTRAPGAAGLPSALHLPGRPGWQVFARAGQALSWASGRNQESYAVHVAAVATRRAPTLEPGLHRVQDLITLAELDGLDGLVLGRSHPALGVRQS